MKEAKRKSPLQKAETFCGILYVLAGVHLVMAFAHARESITWFLPSNMPAEFTSRQIVAEIWTAGLLILGTVELGFTFLISVYLKVLKTVSEALEENNGGDDR